MIAEYNEENGQKQIPYEGDDGEGWQNDKLRFGVRIERVRTALSKG